MMVTMRSSSSEVISPALRTSCVSGWSRAMRATCGTISPFIQVDIGFLADQVGVSASHALDLGQGVHDLLLAVDVGVEETEDELKVRLLP